MKLRILTLSLLLAILALTISGPVTAQDPEPWGHHLPGFKEPKPGSLGLPHGDSHQAPDGLLVMPPDIYPPIETRGAFPQATGGPDDFGYTWDDSVQFSWIDATSGTNSGLQGDDQYTGPIDIGFDFRFYENTYSQLYITTNGLVTFGEGAYQYSNLPIPNPALPNNFIAVFWDDLCVNYGNYNTGAVYYKSGGIAPNRYFVVEWYQVSRLGSTDLATFEVIIYENGDIVTQYLSLSGYLQSATVGIEDDVGGTGLQYLYNAPGLSNNKAIRFYRPGPAARVKIWPLYQGRFTRPGAEEVFQIPVRNTGELGSDTYDLTPSSAWAATLYGPNGITPLVDTDSDGVVDTGPVSQGETFTVTARIQTPLSASAGSYNFATLTVRSSLNISKSKTVTLQTAIPAPFAQVYRDDTDGAMSLYLVQPLAQSVQQATEDWHYGYTMAVAETPNSFAYFWNRYRWTGSVGTGEIEYVLLDRYGNTVRGVSRLTNHSAAAMSTYDYPVAVAVAPNGRIGVAWYRYLWNSSTSQYNYNIWFAILDSSGNVVYGPVNLTNNNAWGTWSDYNVPQLYSPRIAATGDNRFLIAWHREHQESSGWVEDIYYTVRDANGGTVKGVTRFTNDTPGWDDGHNGVNLAPLTNNRIIMTWFRSGASGGVYFAVFDSAGNVVKNMTNLGMDGSGTWYASTDVVQLPNGRIVVVWVKDLQVRFAVLDSNWNKVVWYTQLDNPIAPTGNCYVSVAADQANRAILTWMDYSWDNRRNLYYALVDSNGSVLTPPILFRTSQAYIETSYEGYGNTSYSWTPPADVDLVASFPATLFGGPPGGNAAVGIRTANHGTTLATNVILTATLASDLTYVSDTSGIAPTISGNDVVWNLPDLDFLDSFNFTLHAQVPSAAEYGARYPITLTLTAAGPEANFSDNTANAQVMAARQVFLPLILRGY